MQDVMEKLVAEIKELTRAVAATKPLSRPVFSQGLDLGTWTATALKRHRQGSASAGMDVNRPCQK